MASSEQLSKDTLDSPDDYFSSYEGAVFNNKYTFDRRTSDSLLQDLGKYYPHIDIDKVDPDSYSVGVALFMHDDNNEIITLPHIIEPKNSCRYNPHSLIAQNLQLKNDRYMKDIYWPLYNWHYGNNGNYITWTNTVYGKIGDLNYRNEVALTFANRLPQLASFIITHTMFDGAYTHKEKTKQISLTTQELMNKNRKIA